MSYWSGKKVMITGGSGFLGSQIVDILEKEDCQVLAPRSRDYNFVHFEDSERFFTEHKPDLVIHCAAYYGGIWINQLYPGKIYFENLVMGANIMEAARRNDVGKVVQIGTACSYPGYLENVLNEENLWDGPPHDTVIHYGLTKKIMNVQGIAYKKQYGLDSIHLILTNLYGPRDTFNPDRSHVVSALIRKFVEAKQAESPTVEVWGTGKPIREFMYVGDCAEAIVKAAENYNDLMPMNIGTGIGTSIRELAEAIGEVTDYRGEIDWNTEKPDGQMKKILDVERMQSTLGWTPPNDIREGLRKTIAWYIDNKEEADKRA